MDSDNLFHIADYCVLIGMMLLSLLIGVYYAFSGQRQRTTQEYFVGNKSMGLFPITLSLLASFFSSNTLIGIPAEVYAFGFNWWFSLIGALAAMPFVAYWMMPVFYNLGATSVYEYLELRFDRRVRLSSSFFYVIYLAFYAAFVTYGPALALSQVTGLNFWISVVTMCTVGTIYTVIGGIKAVMWTDSLQMLVVIGSMLIVLVKGLMEVGGFQELYIRNLEGRRLQPLSFSLDPRIRNTFWGVGTFGLLLWGGIYGTSQYQVQRYLSAPTIQVARRSVWMNLPGQFLVQTMVCLIGLLMYAKYWDCDPLATKRIYALDQLFPVYVMDTLAGYPGLPGLFVAGIFSGSLSTTSSLLNCLSVIVLNDYIKPRRRWAKISDETAAKFAKFIASFFGIFTILMVGIVSVVGSDIQQASGTILGCLSGTVYGVFFAGIFCPWIQATGALIGMLTAFAFSTWIGLGISLTKASSLQKLPISTQCLNTAVNSSLSTILSNATFMENGSASKSTEIFQLYQISYMWNYNFCIFIIAIVGTVYCIYKNDYIYDKRLYSPLVNYIHAKILKRKQENKKIATTYSSCPTQEKIIEKEDF